MDGENARADTPVDNSVPAAELTEQQKAHLQRAKEAGWTEREQFDYEGLGHSDRDDGDWFGAAKVYQIEWQDAYGEVGPEIPELEAVLFNGEFQQRKGEHMEGLEFDVQVDGPDNKRIHKVSF